jgi:succinyldiaminopimelate transaminase
VVVQQALAGASDSPGYPLTVGTEDLRRACLEWLSGSHGVTGLGLDQVLPVIGSKELIGSLALHLGLGPVDLVAYPELAYPTYEVGARLAGTRTVATDRPEDLGREAPTLLWLNSPSNPTGRVLDVARLRELVAWAREHDTLLVSDECYLECAWDAEPVSLLHPSVCDGDTTGLLTVHSLSKRSNLAGYRCAFVAGDAAVVGELLAVRKNLGLQLPGPQQVAMAAALRDTAHAVEQHDRYAARRVVLREALVGAGFTVEHSEASLYLWVTRDEDCWDTVSWLAERGVLVAPGVFYGAAGSRHVRVALTATDERVAAAAARLA